MYKSLASALIGLQATDGFMTMWATKHGFVEQNPLMVPIAETWMLPILKIGLTLAVTLAFVPLTRKYRRVLVSGLALGNVVLMVVIGSNILELVSGP